MMLILVLKWVVVWSAILALLLVLCVVFFQLGPHLGGAGDSEATADSWVDLDGNGSKDLGEPPLGGVFIWAGQMPYAAKSESANQLCERIGSPSCTDKEGRWSQFLPGGSCGQVTVFARTPVGYQATSDLAVSGCSAHFGFARDGTPIKHKVLGVSEYAQRYSEQEDFNGKVKLVLFALAVFGFAAFARTRLIRRNTN